MITPQDKQRYQADGFLVVRGVFSKQDLEEIRRGSEEIALMARPFRDDAYVDVTYFNLHRNCDPFDKNISNVEKIHGELRRVTYPYAVSPILDRYRTQERLLSVVSDLLGPDLVQIVNQLNFNLPGIGTGWGWHQDYRFRKPGINDMVKQFVQTILAVDRSYSGNGGVRFVPRSHELGSLTLDLDTENAEQHFDAKTAVTPDMAPGDVILFNPYVIHGSTPNRSQLPRRVYINGFANAKASEHGMPVLVNGRVVKDIRGIMEYEKTPDMLPLAAKY